MGVRDEELGVGGYQGGRGRALLFFPKFFFFLNQRFLLGGRRGFLGKESIWYLIFFKGLGYRLVFWWRWGGRRG